MKSKERIKAILFDLDDTLVNSRQAEFNAICEFKKLYNEFKQVENNEFSKQWSRITTERYEKYFRGEISFEKLRIERMKGLFNYYKTTISDGEAEEKYKQYQEIYEKNWNLFDDAEEVLNNLHTKYRLAIISNGDTVQQRKKIEYTGLNKYFLEIVISSEVGVSKPDRRIFELTCERMNVKPEECIMIGDKFSVDVEGGINAGITSIWVDRKNDSTNYKYKVSELSQIIQYINES